MTWQATALVNEMQLNVVLLWTTEALNYSHLADVFIQSDMHLM